MTCPHCGSPSLRPARRRTTDLPLLILGLAPWRCRGCRARFRTRAASSATPVRHRASSRSRAGRFKNLKRYAREALIVAAALFVFLVFLRYLTSESGSPSSQRLVPASALSLVG